MSSYYKMIEAVFANPEVNFAQFFWWAEKGPTGEDRTRLFPHGPLCEIMFASDQPRHGRADEWTKERPWFIRVQLSRATWERWKGTDNGWRCRNNVPRGLDNSPERT